MILDPAWSGSWEPSIESNIYKGLHEESWLSNFMYKARNISLKKGQCWSILPLFGTKKNFELNIIVFFFNQKNRKHVMKTLWEKGIKIRRVQSRPIFSFTLFGSRYSRMDQANFVEDSLYSSRLYHFKFFKGCYPQILLCTFLNTLTYFWVPLTIYRE